MWKWAVLPIYWVDYVGRQSLKDTEVRQQLGPNPEHEPRTAKCALAHAAAKQSPNAQDTHSHMSLFTVRRAVRDTAAEFPSLPRSTLILMPKMLSSRSPQVLQHSPVPQVPTSTLNTAQFHKCQHHTEPPLQPYIITVIL